MLDQLNQTQKDKEAIYENFAKFFTLVSTEVAEQNGAKCTVSAVPFPVFNSVIASPSKDNLVPTINWAKALYQQKNVPCLWWRTGINEPDNLHDVLIQEGFQEVPGFEGMSYDLRKLPEKPKELSNIKVQQITDRKDLIELNQVVSICFELTEEAARHYLNIFDKLFDDPNIRHYKIEQEGKIVATGTIFRDGKTCGFYNLGVLPGYTRKGLATAMQWHRLHEAKALGADNVVLQASNAANALDQKVGFTSCMRFTPYLRNV